MRFERTLVICAVTVVFLCSAFGVGMAVASVSATRTLDFSPVIIIDAGHGGFDGGAVGTDGIEEKTINLSISKKLAQLAELYGYEVIMVREDDVAVNDENLKSTRSKKVSDLHNRLALADKNPQALFISIHQNKFPQAQSWGTQVFYSKNNPRSEQLAQCIQNNVHTILQPDNDRQIKPAEKNLYILYNIKNPAVIVECGFLSNAQECARLQDEEYQQKLAFVILQSLVEENKMNEG